MMLLYNREVENLSMEHYLQFQPSKQKKKKNIDFDSSFKFFSNDVEYSQDSWNDLTKYVKRKSKSKVDDKIQEARKSNKVNILSEFPTFFYY